MQELRGDFDGSLHVTEGLAIAGSVSRTVTVGGGGRFVLRGVCGADVVVEHDGDAELWGIVKGSVRNAGGAVTIFGLVKGDVETTAGSTWISPDSVVRGAIRSPGDETQGVASAG